MRPTSRRRLRALAFGVVTGLLVFELVLQVAALVLWSTGSREGGSVDDRRTVLCVGDSFTYGLGASGPDAAYPAELQRVLDARAPGTYHVVNGGRSGRSTRDVAQELVRQLDEFDPAVVVVLAGYNDRWKNPGLLTREDLPSTESLRERGFPLRWRTGALLSRLLGALVGDGPGTAAPAGPTGRKALLGAWRSPQLEVTFRADGTCIVGGVRGSFEVDGSRLVLGGASPVELDFTRRGALLVLEGAGVPGGHLELEPVDPSTATDSSEGFRELADDPSRHFRSVDQVRAACARLRADPAESAEWYLGAVAAAQGLGTEEFAATVDAGLRALDPDDPWRAGLLRIRAGLTEAHEFEEAMAATLEAALVDGQDFAAVGWMQARDPERIAAAAEPAIARVMAARGGVDVERLRGLVRRASGTEQEVGRVLLGHVALIRELVEDAGAVLVLATYPEREPVVDEAIRTAAQRLEVPLADAAARFDEVLPDTTREQLFVADGHCTDAGYALLATTVADRVLEVARD